mmetsp:Transcript_3574/g.14081  ORF Transcript_3574/g.14081 Transcript_3574/m.14081 type:complete len:202 (-) Transcript_3574:247-852(-)|eukprot:scaffold7381_cov310-Pinguiococcus_pyrenoidosus.AAC.32
MELTYANEASGKSPVRSRRAGTASKRQTSQRFRRFDALKLSSVELSLGSHLGTTADLYLDGAMDGRTAALNLSPMASKPCIHCSLILRKLEAADAADVESALVLRGSPSSYPITTTCGSGMESRKEKVSSKESCASSFSTSSYSQLSPGGVASPDSPRGLRRSPSSSRGVKTTAALRKASRSSASVATLLSGHVADRSFIL